MYKIAEEHVEMYTGYGTEGEALIGILGPGTCFGEFGVLTGMPAIYTIIAYSDVKLLRVDAALLEDFVKNNFDDVFQIMSNMANNMLRMQHQIKQLGEELAELENKDKDKAADNLVRENIRNYAIYKPVETTSKETEGSSGGGMHFIKK